MREKKNKNKNLTLTSLSVCLFTLFCMFLFLFYFVYFNVGPTCPIFFHFLVRFSSETNHFVPVSISFIIITYPSIYTIVQIFFFFIKILLYKTLLQKCYSMPHVGLLHNHDLVGVSFPCIIPVPERGSHDGVSNAQ